MKYRVDVVTTKVYRICVDADSKDDAISKAREEISCTGYDSFELIGEDIDGIYAIAVKSEKSKYEDMLKAYFIQNRDEVIDYVMDRLGYDDFQKMSDDEYNMKWGFDCGWTILHPKDDEMCKRFASEDEFGSDAIFVYPSWSPQSVTCKRPQVEKALRDLGLEDVFCIECRLD